MRHVTSTCFVSVNLALPLKSFLLSTKSLNISRAILIAAVMLPACTPSSLAQVAQPGRDALLRGDYDLVIPDEFQFSSQQQVAGTGTHEFAPPGQLLRRSAYRTLSARTGDREQKTTANPKQRGAEL